MKIQNFQLQTIIPQQFDTIIDVRSPAEYSEDHIPGAINLPVLSDQERKIVGTLYKQESKLEARKIGAKFVSDNISKHLGGILAEKEDQWKVLIYCWRGGQRSRSLGIVLSEIGWQTYILDGGYKSYRRLIVDKLYEKHLENNVIVISGYTGTGKTKVLGKLKKLGGQVIDLEELANHRGSIFGSRSSRQPSQKEFESRIAKLLEKFSKNHPIFLESESNQIGYLKIPPSLWQKMKASPHIELYAKIEQRAEFLISEYPELYENPEGLLQKIKLLSGFHSKKQIFAWLNLAKKKQFQLLAQGLMTDHYDPKYGNASNHKETSRRYRISINPRDSKNVTRVASSILDKAFSEKIN